MSEAEIKLHVGVACGGTGGHTIPGLATARELRERGHEVTLWLAGKDIEARTVEGWEGVIHRIQAQGLPSGFSVRSISAGISLLGGAKACRNMMKPDPPDVMLAMGSYASVGPVLAAWSLRVPIVLHEANVLPGKAISLLARLADAVGLAFEQTRNHLAHKRLRVTGMPLRRKIEEPGRRIYPDGLDRDTFTILVMGGSRGAHKLNDVVSCVLCDLVKRGVSLQAIHLTGVPDENFIRERYQQEGVRAVVRAFEHDMASLYHASDFAICRSGAATCAELAVLGLPALLVPYPFAVNNHQLANARVLEEQGMADVREEAQLTGEWLRRYLAESLANKERVAAMSAAAKRFACRRAARELADLVCQIAGERAGNRQKTLSS